MNSINHLPSVSVIIPVYQAEKWLPAIFNGLDGQTFRSFEVVFVNDGSTDKTGALLDAYASSRDGVNVIHRKNQGVGGARNTGVDAARGEYVVFVDADDFIYDSHLDDLYSLAVSLDLDVAMCNGWRFHQIPGDSSHEPLVTKKFPEEKAMTGIEWFETTFNNGEWWGYPWMTMVRRDFLKRHSIRFTEGMAFEDNYWNVMVQSRAERVAYTSKQSYYYRRTPGSILNDMSLPRKIWRINSYIRMIELLWRTGDSETPRRALLFKRLAAYQGRTLLSNLAELGSLKTRISISLDLKRRGLLVRMFREVEVVAHRKRILRAYWFAWLGMMVEFFMFGESRELDMNCKK